MNEIINGTPEAADLSEGKGIDQRSLTGLMATALLDTTTVANSLRAADISEWSPSEKSLHGYLLERLEDEPVFEQDVVAALNNMSDLLKAKIEEDTDIDWQLDECANEGGYEVVHFGPEAEALHPLKYDIRKANDAILAVICATKALRIARELSGA
jgi:hypothetical protein